LDINATLFGQMLTFAIFVWFSMRYVWPLLERSLEERHKKIADGLAASERGHKELALAQAKATKQLHDARLRANEIIVNANQQALLLLEEARAAANKEREQILIAGRLQIRYESEETAEKLRKESVIMALATAEKLLSRAITAQDQALVFQNMALGK